MGNCLKTQLKGIVNNDNLEYLGKFTYDTNWHIDQVVYTSGINTITSDAGGTFSYKIGSASWVDNVTEITFPNNNNCYVRNITSKVYAPKYNLDYANIVGDFDFNSNINIFDTVTRLGFSEGTNSIYEIEKLPSNIDRLSMDGPHYCISLNTLSKYNTLTYLEIKNTLYGEDKDLLILIKKYIANGRTSATINGGNFRAFKINNETIDSRVYSKLTWEPISGTSNYAVHFETGTSASNLSMNINLTINSNGEVVS